MAAPRVPLLALRGSAGVWTASGPPDLSQQLPSPTDPSSQCKVLALSKDGTLLAWSNTENIKIAELTYGEIFHEIAHSRVNELQFSPHGNLLASWEPYRVDRDGDTAVGIPNLHIWDVKTGTLVKKFIQKKQQNWSPQWTNDEVLCVRNVNNELHFFEKGDFDTIKEKLHCQKVSQFDIAPCTDQYYLAVYVPGSKGQPSFVRAFLYPNFGGQNTAVANKSFFKAERVTTFWNKKGSSLLVLTSTEMSDSSYYGEQGLHFLSIKGETCFVQLSKNGPIYSVEWAPDSSSFCVVYGYMPAKATLFDAKAEPVFDFGTGPRNMVAYNSFGTMLCLAGFGNLRGHVEFWDVRQKKIVNQAQADDTTYLEWCPDGEHILTATTSPRLRVNNGYNIWHYTGTLVDKCSLDGQELWEIRWQPAPEGTFVRKPIKYKPIESSHFVQPDLPNVIAGVYRPPQARIPGAQPMTNTSLHTYEPPADLKQQQQSADGISKTAAKNKKKREAKKQKQLPDFEAAFVASQSGLQPEPMVPDSTGDPEKDKKIKNLKKKIQQIEKLKEQQRAGKPLEKNQLEKLKTASALATELKELYLE